MSATVEFFQKVGVNRTAQAAVVFISKNVLILLKFLQTDIPTQDIHELDSFLKQIN